MAALYSPVSGSRGVPSARIWPKPAKASGTSGASVPAPSMMSAWPRTIVSIASPMAWPPVAQALTTAMFGPRMPNSIATCPDGESGSMCGSMNGRDAPRAALEEGLVAVEQQADAADPGAEHHAEAIGVDVAA